MPDAPAWLVKLAAQYHIGAWRLTPLVRYVGSRYGDVLNTEKVDAYLTIDLDATYRVGKVAGIGSVEIGLAAQNLFDQGYIGSIDVGRDDTHPGTIDYYPGAPRSLALTLSASF